MEQGPWWVQLMKKTHSKKSHATVPLGKIFIFLPKGSVSNHLSVQILCLTVLVYKIHVYNICADKKNAHNLLFVFHFSLLEI
jgi:hypothetical protein